MLTLSGSLVTPESNGSPTVHDIAVGLGRTTRFSGQTKIWWPVLLHSLVCEEIARDYWRDTSYTDAERSYLRLKMLLHDAHEAITSDVTTSWKPDALRSLQSILDGRIYKTLRVSLNESSKFQVPQKAIDRMALLAEGALIGPPGFLDAVAGRPDFLGLGAVTHIMTLYFDPADTIREDGRAVVAFKRLLGQLLKDVTGTEFSTERR